ncbi:AlpA family transcriptional regulator [Vibrio crassostreae]|nr:AlpA family transcriptional regulator [Vibrio crassostreae]
MAWCIFFVSKHKSGISMRFLKIKEVMTKTALSRSSIYRKMSEGSFPKPVPIGERAVAWIDSDVEEWMKECVKQR